MDENELNNGKKTILIVDEMFLRIVSTFGGL